MIYDVIEDALESLNYLWRKFMLLNRDSLNAIHAARTFNK